MCKKIYCFFIYFLVIAAVVFGGISLYVYSTNKPPLAEINQARESLALAKNKLAGRYAGETLKEAERLFNLSLKEWELQNSKSFLIRDYALTLDLALQSNEKSASAIDETNQTRNKVKNNVQTRLTVLHNKIEKFERLYKNLVLSKKTIHDFNKGKNLFLEAQIEYKKNNFLDASKHSAKSLELISQAEKSAHILLTEYYKNYPAWKANTKLAYNISKKGQTVILIDKIQSTLIILKGGKEYKELTVEFGKNWMGDKSFEGDMATPEGVYKVLEKKSNSKTKYYKALLINYPNAEDQKKYKRMIKSGEITKGNGIGGLIEIHGDGGKGIHWTDGCIALENGEMDIVYKNSSVNTPVIIVGSRIPLEAYLN